MYAFSEDEKHLLFMDMFGLTRLSRPKQLKTDVKVSGSESAGILSVSRDGSLASSYEDLWDKSVLWSFPELKPAKRFERFRESGLVVHPEASHTIVREGDSLRLTPVRKGVLLPLRLDAPPRPRASNDDPVTLSLRGGQARPPIDLGGAGQLEPATPLRIAHDGTLLCCRDGELIGATLAGTRLQVHWRRPVTGPDRARLDVHGDAQRLVLIVHRDRRWTVFVADAAGERSFEIESLAVPAVAGRYLAWQPSADRIVRRDLGSGERLEDTEYTLRADQAGFVSLFAGARGSLLALLGDRERLVDLVTGVELSRKLPAKHTELRQDLLARARPYMEAARLAGVTLELGRVELDSKYNSVSITHRIAGPANLFGALLASTSQAVWSDVTLADGWRMGSYGSHGGISYDPSLSVDALIAGYSGLAAAGFGFAATAQFWSGQFERWGQPPRDPACVALLAQALVAVVRDGAARPLDYRALAARGAPSVDEVLDVFRAQFSARVDQRELDHNAAKLAGGLFNHLFGAAAARLWIGLYLAGDGLDPQGGSGFYDFGHYGLEALISQRPEAAAEVRAWLAAHPEVDESRAYYVDQVRQRLA